MTNWYSRNVAAESPASTLVLRGLFQGLVAGVIFGVIIGVADGASHGLARGAIFGAVMIVFSIAYLFYLRHRAQQRAASDPRT